MTGRQLLKDGAYGNFLNRMSPFVLNFFPSRSLDTCYIDIGNLKPILHCDAKPLALGPGFCLDPNATMLLVSKNVKICVTPNAKPKICVSPNARFSRWQCTFNLFLC